MKATAKPEYDIARSCFASEWDDATTNWNLTAETSFLYDNWNMIQEIQLSALSFEPQTNNSWFVWGLDLSGSLSGAGGIGGLLTSISGTNAVCYTYDANGNVSEMLSGLSSELSILAHYEYSPFGETIVATGELAKENQYRFSTKYTDDETKLVYYGYRFYSPDLGRWLSRDPLEESIDRFNLLTFCNNTPQRLVDFMGLCVIYGEADNVDEDDVCCTQIMDLWQRMGGSKNDCEAACKKAYWANFSASGATLTSIITAWLGAETLGAAIAIPAGWSMGVGWGCSMACDLDICTKTAPPTCYLATVGWFPWSKKCKKKYKCDEPEDLTIWGDGSDVKW